MGVPPPGTKDLPDNQARSNERRKIPTCAVHLRTAEKWEASTVAFPCSLALIATRYQRGSNKHVHGILKQTEMSNT